MIMMNKNEKAKLILKVLDELFQNAKCALNYNKDYELAIAVMLSAQTSDNKVNEVTPILFNKYNSLSSLANADIKDVENIIKKLGLYKNKSQNLILFSQKLLENFNGALPSDKKELTSLPGIGNKSAAVIRIEIFHIPDFPVDTHISRICKRLGFVAKSDNPDKISLKLKKIFPIDTWIKLHHQMICFGRNICHAQSPNCSVCPLKSICKFK